MVASGDRPDVPSEARLLRCHDDQHRRHGDLPPALTDRFPVKIRINEPHPDALERLSYDLRGIAKNLCDAGERRVSLRAFMTFDQMRKTIGTEDASKIIFGDRAESILDAMKIEAVA